MAAFRYFVIFAFVVACILAIQAAEPEQPGQQQTYGQAPVEPQSNRQKRFPYTYGLGLGYSAYAAPLAYHAPLAYSSPFAYHAGAYPALSPYHAPLYY